jgi:hypothetical protein
MKITISKLTQEEMELPKFFKLDFSQWYYAIIDDQTLLHVKISTYNYPLIEQVGINLHSTVISSNTLVEVTEQEFKDKFTEAYLRLAELAN